MEIVLGISVGALFFASTVGAYVMGIKHGKVIKDNGVPVVNPLNIIKGNNTAKEVQKAADDLSNQINNMLMFGEVTNEK